MALLGAAANSTGNKNDVTLIEWLNEVGATSSTGNLQLARQKGYPPKNIYVIV